MKSELPYLGVRMPDLRRTWRVLLDEWQIDDEAALQDAIRELWDEAEFREERYTALALLERHPEHVTLPLLERLIVEGAWWDLVDTLAKRVGDLLRRDPSVADEMRRWSRDENLWKRRVSIICQLRFAGETDLELLYDCIEPNLAGPRVLRAQGDRLGPSRLRVARPAGSRPLRAGARRPAIGAEPAGGDEEPG